jgi:hypothetical protein
MEYVKKIEYATRISTLLRDATYPIVLECVYSKDYNDVYFIQLLRVQMAGNKIVVFGTELNNNFGRRCSIEDVVAVYFQDDNKLIKLFDVER